MKQTEEQIIDDLLISDNAFEKIVEVLKNKENPNTLRMEAALGLVNLRDDRAITPIIETINEYPLNEAGTLFFALISFDCTSYLQKILERVILESWESQNYILEMIYHIPTIDSQEKKELIEMLTNKKKEILKENVTSINQILFIDRVKGMIEFIRDKQILEKAKIIPFKK